MATDNNNKVLNVPNLRFPEFTEEWKETKIGDITSKVGSGVTPKGGSAVYKTSGHLFIRSQNVGNGRFLLDDVAYIDEATHKKQINTELKDGDVLLNITGASIGRTTVVNKNVEGGNVNQHVCIIRLLEDYSPNYICNYLLSYGGQKQIDSFQAGGNREGLNFEQIRSIKFSIPSFREQSKIASLLSLLEERIATQNKIIEQLQSLIKGIVVEHYNKSHKTKVKIKDLGKSYSVMNMSKEDLSETGNECIIYGELFTTYDCVATDVVSKTKKSIQSSTISTGYDLLFPASTTVDAQSLIAPTAISHPNIILGGDMFGIVVTNEYNNEYLSYIFNYVYKYYLARYAQGSTIIHLHYNDIKNLDIELPDIKAQNELVLLLKNIQDKILTEKKMRSMLGTQKAYLLRNLFI